MHVFCCVLALAVAHLIRRADHASLRMSVRELLAKPAGVGETVLLYYNGGKGRPGEQHLVTDMTTTQKRFADLFNIYRYASHPVMKT